MVLENNSSKIKLKQITRLKLSILSLVVGVTFVFIVGLSNPVNLHNAAHDVRHSSAFPCH